MKLSFFFEHQLNSISTPTEQALCHSPKNNLANHANGAALRKITIFMPETEDKV